jgi:CheY-like chemotaxis protein
MDLRAVEPDPLEATRLARLKVLVVDDHQINRHVVSLIVGAAGAEVTCVATAAEAMEHLASRPFDAILMDAALGFPGGGKLVLRDLPGPNTSVPVISITGRDTEDEAEVTHAAGVTMEIGRFIDPAALCAALGALLVPAANASKAVA